MNLNLWKVSLKMKLIIFVILGRLVINILNKCYLMIKCSFMFNLIKKKLIKLFSINMMCIIIIYL